MGDSSHGANYGGKAHWNSWLEVIDSGKRGPLRPKAIRAVGARRDSHCSSRASSPFQSSPASRQAQSPNSLPQDIMK
jgi:hypothetical protein